MADKSARNIMKGKVGDKFEISNNYEGKFVNAVGVPLDTPRGPAVPIPPGSGDPNCTVIERPDFRKFDKNAPVHHK